MSKHADKSEVPYGEPENTRRRAASRERVPIFIAVGIGFVILYLIQPILLPFLFSGIVGFLAAPLLTWCARRTGLPRWLFAALLFVLILAAILGAAYLVVPRMLSEARAMLHDFEPTLASMIRQFLGEQSLQVLGEQLNPAELAQKIVSILREQLSQAGTLTKVAEWSFAGIFGFFLTLVLLFYCLAAGPRLGAGLLWLVPPLHRDATARIWARLDPVLRRYFLGVLVVVIYATGAAYLGLGLILGIHHALLLAILTGLLEMIPVIGPISSAVIAGLVAVRYATGLDSIIEYAIYATVLRLSIDELLGPVVLGRAAHVHPVMVIFCFLAGGILFGIPGVIMAIPVALGFKHSLAVLYDEPV
ncbi:MAG TPA: AI-2E family transporter [Xanthobacteraceae bacterium]|nr:AI-2E family transporter [Xanthobacteraceae bacterium]